MVRVCVCVFEETQDILIVVLFGFPRTLVFGLIPNAPFLPLL